jgi:signal transduction histidine kinase
MIPKKLYFLIYIILVVSLQSCKKTTPFIPEKKDNLIEFNRLIALGEQFFESSKYDSSYYYFYKAKLACDPKKHPKLFVYAISNLATIQQNQGDYNGSETTAIEAMPVLETTNNPQYKWNIYNILGINYLNTFDYDNALYYFNKSLYLKTDIYRKNGSKNNLALVYLQKGQNEKALNIYQNLLLKEEIINKPITYSQTLSNIGYCYNKTHNSKAIDFLSKSLKIRLEIHDEKGLIATYYNLSNYYKERNPNLAIKYVDLAYKKASKLNSVDDRLGSLKLLIELSNGNKLKDYSFKYVQINDSITKVHQQAKNQFAKMKYDSKKEKDENLILKAQKAENELQLQVHENTTLMLYYIVGFILTITGFIFFFLVEKGKREKINSSYDTEIRIAKRLHDELANDVYQTMAFTETQDLSSVDNKETLLDKLDTIYSRTRNISKENSIIPTGIDFIPHLKEMIASFDTASVTILIQGLNSIKWSSVPDQKKITIFRVLQELLINMKKHSKSSLVVLSFQKQETILQVDYTDNGVGTTKEQLNLKTGLQNVENRIHAIKGTITFDTETGKGFKVNILFPI